MNPLSTAGEPAVTLLFASGLMLLGVLVQFVAKMALLEDAGAKPSAFAYLRDHPYRSIFLLLSAWLGLYICHEMHELTRVTAVLIGFGCETAAAGLHKKAEKLGVPT